MRMHVVAALMIALCGGGGSAAAQEPDVIYFARGVSDSGDGQGGIAGAVRQIQGVGGQDVTFEMPIDVLAAEPLDVGKPVTGAPYSADITTEIVQQLADGNRIERRSTSSVARDGEGRVRREQQVTAIGPILPSRNAQIVTINDPVAKVHYSLDTERKVAIQLPMPLAAKFVGAGPDRTLFVARTEKGDLVPPPLVGARQVQDARTETLGTKEVEGVTAEGTRVTVSIPAGAIGNLAPIEIVSERWYSPELQTVVLSRRSDPRFGETTYRLTNIVRAEPPAELFQLPADYKIESPKAIPFDMRKVPPPPGP
jgi:hypothetical protein